MIMILINIKKVKRKDNSVCDTVFAWGEYQQCQLSTGMVVVVLLLVALD